MEIVVTAPTPMVQSPVSEEEDENQSFGRDDEAVEKGEQEEMEKSTKSEKIEEEKVSEDELVPEKSTNNGEVDLNEVDLILKREHFVERRSSSSDSEFSLGPRAAVALPTPAGKTPYQ